ncbi:uncharacterized protein B0P05DRAFT_568565 [Gilbertella persicaria]|uniref:uncharacterized protein n=1 Tax=Gilbertella persicaria TaxID=101096 RepID=UPI00221F679A|nr:uncharacterized protein B0P05DRAFT_568565 [Gilbertella persicaria]KAI8092423.1 hypothetical protein B0P05DRAFT_568565 [Gilbertella persicaria]
MSTDISSTRKEDAQLSLTGMATQLGINAAIAVVVYAPKYKYASKSKQPPEIGHGFFAWFGPVIYTPDNVLIEKIGYDATLFVQFLRMIRRMLYIMTFIGGNEKDVRPREWPPEPGVEFLSISTINYYDGKFHFSNGNLSWYWCHAVGTWLFSVVIYVFLWRFYMNYVKLRKDYFESDEYQKSMHARTLMIFNVPPSMRNDKALADWVNGMGLKYPAQQICIGTQNAELGKYVEEHEEAVRKLEITLSNHLKDGQVVQNKKRPLVRIGGFLGCCGGTKVDAINYYSEKVQELQEKTTKARAEIFSSKKTNYGWISYEKVEWAHANAKYLASAASPLLSLPKLLTDGPMPTIELAPQPKDIIWSNLAMNEHVRRTKRLVVTTIFYGFVFFWFIPSSFLSASSNVKGFLRLFPNSTKFMKAHPTFVSLLSSWFTPIVMAIFFFILPKILRFMSQQQGYMTGTSLDRQVLAKLFVFFIVNNLLVFTISSTLMSLYAEIQQAAKNGQNLNAHDFFYTITSNLTQVAKNLSDVSTYWVNYVSLKGLGVIVDLAQVVVLITVTLRKFFTQPSPRQLQEFTRPSPFDYPLFYNVLLFFFTVGLIYSVIAPLVLPFTLMYFILATMVFKYLLMYVFATHVETGGQIWRLLFNRLLVSTTLFQVVMIGVLNLKSAQAPSMCLIPLPFITIIYKFICSRRFDPLVYYYTPKHTTENQLYPDNDMSTPTTKTGKHSVGFRFGDPAFFAELPVPMVHERVRHLLPKVYGSSNKTSKKPFISRMTRQKSVRHVSVIHLQNNAGGGGELQFQSVGEKDLEFDDSTEGIKGMYKFNEDEESENIVDPPKTSYYSNSFSNQTIHGNSAATNPLRRLSNRINQSLPHSSNDIYSPTRPLVAGSSESYTDSAQTSTYSPMQTPMSEDMEYFVAGRAYRTHDPHTLDSSNAIEMANMYRAQQQPYQPHHHPSFRENYDHYIRNPLAAHTIGHEREASHSQSMNNPSVQHHYP